MIVNEISIEENWLNSFVGSHCRKNFIWSYVKSEHLSAMKFLMTATSERPDISLFPIILLLSEIVLMDLLTWSTVAKEAAPMEHILFFWSLRGSLSAQNLCTDCPFHTFLGRSTFPEKFSHISFIFTQIVVGVIWVPLWVPQRFLCRHTEICVEASGKTHIFVNAHIFLWTDVGVSAEIGRGVEDSKVTDAKLLT
jgi:hypothetical protein